MDEDTPFLTAAARSSSSLRAWMATMSSIKDDKATIEEQRKISQSLLHALKNRKIATFKAILKGNCDPNFQYLEYANLPILGILVGYKKFDVTEYINAVMETNKVDVNEYYSVMWEKCAIHIAASIGDLTRLKTLVGWKADLGIRDCDGRTALHYLITKVDNKEYKECLKFLLGLVSDEQLNALDQDGYSAIHLAAEKKVFWAAETILNSHRRLELQLDDYFGAVNGRRKCAREALLEAFPLLETLLPPDSQKVPMDASRLFKLLRHNEEERFAEEFRNSHKSVENLLLADNGKCRLLQEACFRNLGNAVKLLLDFGAESNLTFRMTPTPVYICAEMGHYDSIRHILPLSDEAAKIMALATTCKFNNNSSDRIKIIKTLLSEYHISAFTKDDRGKTPVDYASLRFPQAATLLTDWGFIHRVLKLKSEVNTKQSNTGKCFIHCAAFHGFPEVMKTLVDRGADLGALDRDGRTALHTVVLADWLGNDNTHEECLKTLLDAVSEEQLNILDREGNTALHTALKKKNLIASRLIVYNKRRLGIVLDDEWVRNDEHESIRTSLMDTYRQEFKERFHVSTPAMADSSRLFQLLYSKNENRFCEEFVPNEWELDNLLKVSNGSRTLLQEACSNSLQKVANLLLEYYDQMNLTNQTKHDLVMQCVQAGLHEPAITLLTKCDTATKTIAFHMASKFCESGHIKILKGLLNDKEVDVNAHDKLGNTALFYAQNASGGNGEAVKLLKDEIVRNVLSKTYDGNNSRDDLRNVPWELVRDFLNSKITKDGGKSEENFVIKFDYEWSKWSSNERRKLIEKNRFWKLPLPLLSMSKHPEQKLLLDHPLITAYAYIRWQHIQLLFYLNLIFYLIFCLLLTGYIISRPYLDQLGESEVTFKTNICFRVALFVFTASLLVREVIQLVIRPIEYIRALDNWLELPLAILTSTYLIMDCGCNFKGSNKYVCTQLSAILLLISWIDFMLLVGKHPHCCIEVEMLRSVSISFFKSLKTFIILIIAFGFSFFVLFSDGDDANVFNNPITALMRTIIMLTGEFNSNEINFDTNVVTAHIAFLAFVVLVAIVLLNLLNGLAVADTSSMRKNAYLVSCITRIRIITMFDDVSESKLLFRILKTFKGLYPTSAPWIKVNTSTRQVQLENLKVARYVMDEETVTNARIILEKNKTESQLDLHQKMSKFLTNAESMEVRIQERFRNELKDSVQSLYPNMPQLLSGVEAIQEALKKLTESLPDFPTSTKTLNQTTLMDRVNESEQKEVLTIRGNTLHVVRQILLKSNDETTSHQLEEMVSFIDDLNKSISVSVHVSNDLHKRPTI